MAELGYLLQRIYSAFWNIKLPGVNLTFGKLVIGVFCVAVGITIFTRLFQVFLPKAFEVQKAEHKIEVNRKAMENQKRKYVDERRENDSK